MANLGTVTKRQKLNRQKEPHWQKIAVGRFMGFRRARKGDGGTWIARYYDAETRKQKYHTLGDLGHLPPSERFSAAQKQAREWCEHVGAGGSSKPVTIREVCERYALTRPDAEGRFRRHVYCDPIAKVPLHKLTDRRVRAWRERLENKPAPVGRSKAGPNATRKRSKAALNRDMTALRAALNDALERGEATTARAWHGALKPVKNADNRRNLYLDRAERRRLIEALPPDAVAFARGLCALPLRPGALAALTVGDFDARRKSLVILRDKAGRGRSILLPDGTVALLREQARSKLPTARLFTRADGKPWSKDVWKGPIKEAARAAGLDSRTTAYTLRHSTITDLVVGGLDLATVAQISGTSVRMIEEHYHHLQGERAAEALAGLAL